MLNLSIPTRKEKGQYSRVNGMESNDGAEILMGSGLVCVCVCVHAVLAEMLSHNVGQCWCTAIEPAEQAGMWAKLPGASLIL